MARRTNPPFPFAPGQTAAPDNIDGQSGVVFFADVNGDPVWPGESLCEAYGYQWDEINQMCRAYIPREDISEIGRETSNYVKGGNNEIRANVNNTIIAGQNTLMCGPNNSNIVAGNRNQSDPKVSSSVLLGTLGRSITSNTLTIGGNNGASYDDEETGKFTSVDVVGERQVSFLLFGGYTTNATPTNMWLNNTTGAAYPIPDNAVLMFEIDIMGVAVEPAASRGEFMTWKSNGVTMKKTSGEGGTPIQSRTGEQQNSGSNRWTAEPVIYVDAAGDRFLSLQVVGDGKLQIEWVADLKITQLQTSVAL